ncbi:hypothetical protein AXG93_4182s1230 [Marchantia polymorpha subsp. ruderalis]|uniref:Uncharacterized protein n=1 Tax=Marchantia polymorpha subsp. ruderalis TaxID=1480154 RepID=A0A176VGX8_MARPO|nr:hypothetical protein AXG93_4182s1230 [Marchantia polymorpha subsp. ruderalis]
MPISSCWSCSVQCSAEGICDAVARRSLDLSPRKQSFAPASKERTATAQTVGVTTPGTARFTKKRYNDARRLLLTFKRVSSEQNEATQSFGQIRSLRSTRLRTGQTGVMTTPEAPKVGVTVKKLTGMRLIWTIDNRKAPGATRFLLEWVSMMMAGVLLKLRPVKSSSSAVNG